MERYILANLERMFGKDNVCIFGVDSNKKVGYGLSKKSFVEAIKSIKDSYEWDNRFNSLAEGGCYCNPLADVLIKILNEAIGVDTKDFDTISWWCYELDFGKKGVECVRIDNDTIDITSPEELYDYLIEYEIKKKE